jgi:hypothetical protein
LASRASRRLRPTLPPRSVSTPPSTPGPTRATLRPLTTRLSVVVTRSTARSAPPATRLTASPGATLSASRTQPTRPRPWPLSSSTPTAPTTRARCSSARE